MSMRLQVKDIPTAVEIFYTYPELGTAEVKRLFGCSASSATRLKAMATARQKEKGIMTFSNSSVNTRCAYEAWGIDINDLEKRLLKYQKIKKGMTA